MIDLRQGNCLDVLKAMPDNCIDSIVTDPPYGLSFMGKKWDYDVPSTEIWAECLRVLKPGGHLLSFFGTRTYHRGVVRIENAGFEIRDQIQWLYGSGFPKSMDISKAIDKQAGVEREVIGHQDYSAPDIRGNSYDQAHVSDRERLGVTITAPATDLAKQWQGWGTALKPANEPIVLARKPLDKGLTVADNVIKWGTGGINVDESRILTTDNLNGGAYSGENRASKNGEIFKIFGDVGEYIQPCGRWPANLILDEDAAKMLDEQSGILKSGKLSPDNNMKETTGWSGGSKSDRIKNNFEPNYGGASRFFYVAKTSKSERGENNNHPTVKPIKLMEYLIKLITPPNSTVLDPFMGSGSTGVAAKRLGFSFAGIELDGEYYEIAKKRIEQNDRENIS